jgi:two-component system, LytTR family, response regulator
VTSHEDQALTVLVVDDERPARRKLLRLLQAAPGIEKVYEASSGRLALGVLEEFEPDVLFLDVQMPGMDGFQVLEALGADRAPHVVFVTAYDEHAVRAFEVEAVDYLLKPFDEARFRRALERARSAVASRRTGTKARDLDRVLAAFRGALSGEGPQRLLVTSRPGRKVLLPVESILRIEADRNDAVFHAEGREYRLRTTLTALEDKLDPHRFLRISRSEIVNRPGGAAGAPLPPGDFRVHLDNGNVRRMSRRYRDGMERFR